MQTITSKKTSRLQLPYLHKSPLASACVIESNVLDYGAGLSHEKARECILKNGANAYNWYDPYWNSTGGNVYALMNAPFDVILCSNVLNVIDDNEALFNAVYHMLSLIKHGADGNGVILLTVYEGDRSGVGCATRDGYQRNLKTSAYVEMIQEKFSADYPEYVIIPFIVYRKGRVITIRYKTACEMCRLKSSEICRMCTDFDAAYACPYHDETEFVTHNPAPGYLPVKRMTDFSDTIHNTQYAHTLYMAWNHCHDMTDYENIRNAFLQVKTRYLGIDDSNYEETPPRYPKIMT